MLLVERMSILIRACCRCLHLMVNLQAEDVIEDTSGRCRSPGNAISERSLPFM